MSLLSVWALVGLFYYLNRYRKQDHFTIWTGAWTFYAVWLTMSLAMGEAAPGTLLFTINQTCVSVSAALLLWGSLRFLGIPVPKRQACVISAFLAVWILASPYLVTDSLEAHLPVFILLGLSSPFTAVSLLRLQKQNTLLGVGMLSLGFLLWVIYLGSYPFPHEFGGLLGAGFLVAAVFQLFIAVTMIVLLFHEIRGEAQQARAEIKTVRQEKEALQAKINSATDLVEQQRAEQAAAEQEHLQALGQLTGDVAHDMNNALSPITAYSQLLLCTLPDLTEVQRERLQRINSAAENLAQIVAHMREFYRLNGSPDSLAGATEPAATATDRPLDPDLPPQDEAAACRPLRILCIDDEPILRELMHDVLELDHHKVTVAGNGKDGLDLFRAKLRTTQPYEVVITDLGMPDLDGRNVARAIKAESPKTPVILLTGWGQMMKTDGNTAPEVDAVLGKPPRMQELSNLLFQITEKAKN